jgi:hypothetical protein
MTAIRDIMELHAKATAQEDFKLAADLINLAEYITRPTLGSSWVPNHSNQVSFAKGNETWEKVAPIVHKSNHPNHTDSDGLAKNWTRYWFSTGIRNLWWVEVTDHIGKISSRNLRFYEYG